MGVVVHPSAREPFTTRELVAAYKEFTEHGPQHQDAETGLYLSVLVWRARDHRIPGI